MYWGNTHCRENEDKLPKAIQSCLEFIRNNPLETLPEGRYEIKGDKIFANVIRFTTVEADSKLYEGHKKYADLHYMISGNERIAVNFEHRMHCTSFNEDTDFGTFEGEAGAEYLMTDGDYLVCMPEDIHKPGIMDGQAAEVKKAAFKIALTEL